MFLFSSCVFKKSIGVTHLNNIILAQNFIELGQDKDSLQTGSSGTPQVVSANALPGPDIATAPVVVSQSATTQPAPTQTVSSVTTPAVASTVVTTGGATSTPAEVNRI